MSLENRIIKKHTLIKHIDTGGMSEIWTAKNEIGVEVAIKILDEEHSKDESYLERFQREVTIMVALRHKNIIQIIDRDEIDGRPALIMEYLNGQNLATYLKSKSRLSTTELQGYWNQCIEALNYLHKEDIIHRDLKPSNIFLTKDGVIKIIDFGISKDVNNNNKLTESGATLGTWTYMSPEQFTSSNKVNFQSDFYSLAITFVHLTSGKTPYNSDKLPLPDLLKKIMDHPIDLEGVPIEWQLFLKQFLHKKPEDRGSLMPFFNLTKKEILLPLDPEPKKTTEETIINNNNNNNNNRELLAEQDKKDWEIASKKNTIVSYKNYLINHKDGIYVSLAKNNLKALKTETDTLKKKVTSFVLLAIFLVGFGGYKFFKNSTLNNSEDVTTNKTLKKTNYLALIDWVTIPSGSFIMGSNDRDLYASKDETPAHKVSVNSFKMSKYEITFKQYDVFCEATGKKKPLDNGYGRGNSPVINVTWNDATAYAQWLGARLPTEAEWEYACRAGTKTYFNTGNHLTKTQANYNKSKQIFTVGNFYPNTWGLYDMHGNVREWCSDSYKRDYYKNSPEKNPLGPSSSSKSYRVLRGGSWKDTKEYCRSAHRESSNKGDTDIGFRVVY
jgi:formylglycine-generating enzyme required for sulfatase activity/tRNA A-37 threonylcarbamoyl transferase component Bud32